MKSYRAELHVHTVLSPCAEIEMIPPFIVQEAVDRGIQLLAITDHNASANISAVQKAAQGSGLSILPGMELQTREEVHSLCLFDTQEQICSFQAWVDARLPAIKNRPDYFGEQFVVGETGDFIRREEQLLLVSASCSIEEAYRAVNDLGGLFIPAHINRSAFGLIAVLGLIPVGIPFPALEISRHLTPAQAVEKYPQAAAYPLIRSGDVHRLEEFLGVNEFFIEQPTVAEMKLAFQSSAGRSFKLLHQPGG